MTAASARTRTAVTGARGRDFGRGSTRRSKGSPRAAIWTNRSSGCAPATATAASRFGHRRQDKREGEGECKEHGEHGELTLSVLEGSAEARVAGRRRNDARRAAAISRTEAGKVGRHGRSTASLVDSLGGEEQHGEAVRLASSTCSGTSSAAGDLEGTAAALCKPRARFRVLGSHVGEERGQRR